VISARREGGEAVEFRDSRHMRVACCVMVQRIRWNAGRDTRAGLFKALEPRQNASTDGLLIDMTSSAERRRPCRRAL